MLASVLRDIGAEAAAVGAIIGCLALLARLKPVRWAFARLVGEPVTKWFRDETERIVEGCVADIREQLKPNGGHSLRDRVDSIERKVDQLG